MQDVNKIFVSVILHPRSFVAQRIRFQWKINAGRNFFQAKIEELDQARLANLDVDAKSEIEKAKKEARVARTNSEKLKKEMSEMEILVNSKDEKVNIKTFANSR